LIKKDDNLKPKINFLFTLSLYDIKIDRCAYFSWETMKKTLFGILCLFLFGCESEKICYRENCFVTESQITEDMQKISDIMLRYYREKLGTENEKNLKIVQITCKLFGKDNKKLNKELDKIKKLYDSKEKHRQSKKLDGDLRKSLKGLKLDHKQVLLLAQEIEKTYAKIIADNEKAYASYKDRALEIVKFIDSKDEAKDDWTYSRYEDDIQYWDRLEIYWQMKSIISERYDKFSSYDSLISILSGFINDGTLEDSFLKQHPSSLRPKDEEVFTYGAMSSIWGIAPPIDKNGLIIFDALKGTVANKQFKKTELQEIVNLAARYMRSLTSNIVEIQHDITNKIDHEKYLEQYAERKFGNFYKYDRYFITNLAQKYPKLEDFEKESEKIAARLAY
jgi:hypothetical protein